MVVELLIAYSYLILFIGVVVEGEIFPLAAGFLVSLGYMNLYTSIGVTFIGAFVGDILWFLAARRWGRALVDRWGHLIWLKASRLKWLEEHFANNGKKTLFITKFMYSFGHSSIVVAGIARMNFQEFIKVDLPASFLWAAAFVLLGQFFGGSYGLLKDVLRDVGLALMIVVVLVIGLQVYLRKRLSSQA